MESDGKGGSEKGLEKRADTQEGKVPLRQGLECK